MYTILTSLKIIFRESFYRYVTFYTTLAFSYLSYWLFYKTTTIQTFLQNMKSGDFGSYSVLYGITYIATSILIILLSGVSVATALWLYRHSRLSQTKNISANFGGLLAAAFSMGCPVCGAFLLSAIGVAGGLAVFPLQGLELKFLSLILLIGSLLYGISKVKAAIHCKECNDISHNLKSSVAKQGAQKRFVILPLQNIFVFSLAGLFLVNQLLMSQVAATMGMTSNKGFVAKLLGIQTKSTYTIIAPKINPDGKTTSLFEWPTITEVSANPNSGNALADAKVVMIATGKPFYAPDDVAFDDPINAQKKWGVFETSIKLSTEQETRYQKLISTMMTCSYCCGSANNVTMNKNCGCAHAKAVRGFYRFMITNFGDKYSDEQLVGESHRWYALWYPKGMLEDYLLATGNDSALPHESHGGAGSDGRHGIAR
ncbi:hypothetical protein A2778_05510 [Candidatus Daviesbacteria bacterium RIFCSPHIGHO2_01_FULL_40_24]|uniref:Uncharacterized protein n=1 Tax=Candidatus Daviesbacteria bacterium GW2011_GWC2_40_12 TaxID=1618431 RepID=A0A0G0TXT0_9BACT|nr:MAG: hypothetical protein UT77_C0001G0258 [Candidatus Daviesbacteria bacterium GW2011_GWC2_40_12]OGE21613.1 MAG: hypothetical protein A2778_05510 [Candidatus Daviesbacteria bacterium RIFCSPHIGHO2_01_FULL_40_24]OGE30010.1 MAG: hypothetical protein A3C29_01215 [Candidatus Daviesbacteria bacterium RIFCSPHIGHO2_02_FULL_40_16]OGE43555.1 MAG: hypothetical protein A3A53_02900 [Candidatus Daviesbacteria bacterium RIFCSPLOWO2_01_FULL_39_23]OGE67828.1 MAG: hypothetical protein A3J16_02790 [Candidatus 